MTVVMLFIGFKADLTELELNRASVGSAVNRYRFMFGNE